MRHLEIAKKQLKIDEGLRLKKYRCTAGKWTIGYGHRLVGYELESPSMVQITRERAENIFEKDVATADAAARRIAGTAWEGMTNERRAVLVNMVFQMGEEGVGKFKKFITALHARDWQKAGVEMLDSKWAQKDTPLRARRLYEIMIAQPKKKETVR